MTSETTVLDFFRLYIKQTEKNTVHLTEVCRSSHLLTFSNVSMRCFKSLFSVRNLCKRKKQKEKETYKQEKGWQAFLRGKMTPK